MSESYEQIMRPLFIHLGGDEQQLCADKPHGIELKKERSLRTICEDISENINVVGSAHRVSTVNLETELLAHIYSQTPDFFECIIIDLLLAMGYAHRRRDLTRQVGRSHDGGVDGVITQDPLGLDVILVQAKRLKPGSSVSSSQIRDFIGTLETKKAQKGIFVTTGDFSAFAKSSIEKISHRVRLINGRELSALMVRYNLGAKPVQSYIFKELDLAYFATRGKKTAVRASLQST